jgi:hypothetical protein
LPEIKWLYAFQFSLSKNLFYECYAIIATTVWEIKMSLTLIQTVNNKVSFKDYVCMDKDAEPINSDTSDKDGAVFYAVRTTCGSLRCPPYKNHIESSD